MLTLCLFFFFELLLQFGVGHCQQAVHYLVKIAEFLRILFHNEHLLGPRFNGCVKLDDRAYRSKEKRKRVVWANRIFWVNDWVSVMVFDVL